VVNYWFLAKETLARPELCYIFSMSPLTTTLAQDPRIAYALMFGSRARGRASNTSDLDIAVGLEPGISMSAQELGELIADLERDSGQVVDLILLHEAPPALAYRIFADGQLLAERNHDAFVARKVRAILEYLDFAPFEARCAEGVLRAAANG
jgi:uncharacterized protein